MTLSKKDLQKLMDEGRVVDQGKPVRKITAPKSKLTKEVADLKRKLFKEKCLKRNLPEPVCEFMFNKPDSKHRIDYYFELNDIRVGLEVEGGTYTKSSRHTHIGGYHQDMIKYNLMSTHHIFLIRVTPEKLMNDSTFDMIRKVLHG